MNVRQSMKNEFDITNGRFYMAFDGDICVETMTGVLLI